MESLEAAGRRARPRRARGAPCARRRGRSGTPRGRRTARAGAPRRRPPARSARPRRERGSPAIELRRSARPGLAGRGGSRACLWGRRRSPTRRSRDRCRCSDGSVPGNRRPVSEGLSARSRTMLVTVSAGTTRSAPPAASSERNISAIACAIHEASGSSLRLAMPTIATVGRSFGAPPAPLAPVPPAPPSTAELPLPPEAPPRAPAPPAPPFAAPAFPAVVLSRTRRPQGPIQTPINMRAVAAKSVVPSQRAKGFEGNQLATR